MASWREISLRAEADCLTAAIGRALHCAVKFRQFNGPSLDLRHTSRHTASVQGPSTSDDNHAARAGRGVVSITASKLYFIVAGYAVQLLLPRLLGSPEAFGLYSSAMGVLSILTNVIIVATIQTVSKHVSADPDPEARLRDALGVQLALGAMLGAGLYLGAPLLAQYVLLDPLLAPLFRISAVVVFCYSLYAAIIGFLNGCQRFQRQAFFDLSYTTMRTAGILGAAAGGLGAVGAIGGFASAAVVVLVIALVGVGIGHASEQPLRLRAWLSFMAPLFVYHLCLNMILQVDLGLLKRTIAELALSAGQSAEAAAALASRYAGFYRGAQTFAFVPYQLILSVAFVVFPMVSHANSLGDAETTRMHIRGALRFSLLVLCAIAAPVSGASAGVMRIAYPEAYLAGADALSVLSIGMVAFSLFVIGATILSGAGLPQISATIALLGVLLVVSCNVGFVYAAGLNEAALQAAALGTSVGTCAALVLCALVIYRRFGTFIAPLSALRVLVASGVGFCAARMMPHSTALGAVAALVVGGMSYAGTLVLIRELAARDFQAVVDAMGGRRPPQR